MIASKRTLVLLAAAALALPALAATPAYPAKAVTILVASAPGGPLDDAARRLGQHLTSIWNVPVVVDHRPGAGGTIAAAALARAPADGHTLLIATRAIVVNPALYEKLTFDTATDIQPVAKVNEQPTLLAVARHFPAKTYADVIALLRKDPGKYSFGSAGNGGIPHIAGEMFMRASGTKMIHVPYKGLAPVLTDMQAGRIDMTFASPQTVSAFLADGRLKAIAVASPARSPLSPDLPTFAELGLKDMNISSWYGLFAPAKTAPEIVQKINAGVVDFQKSAAAQKWLREQGAEATPQSVQQFTEDFHRDLVAMSDLLKRLGVKAE
ncbi:MAG: LacI family transcriptional regulator [Ramlibacter sp.]|jgi:tripartite-type tricarboxylate transporter receptor subunit TctC|nr:LacI family transcriptional regulator [Ramlibacter sp.]